MKQFTVIGLGNFGSTVALELAKMDCRVTAVDNDRDKVQKFGDQESLIAVIGDATNQEFLTRLEPQMSETVVVSTGADHHASILITLYLKEMGVKNIIVKANSADHARILTKVGATQTPIPEKQMAVKLARALVQPNLVDFLPLSNQFVVAEIRPTADIIGKSLAESRIRTTQQVLIVAIRKAESDKVIFAPDGSYQLEQSDIMVVIGNEKDIARFKE
jgi:trk system potassium uptake protein TrkA